MTWRFVAGHSLSRMCVQRVSASVVEYYHAGMDVSTKGFKHVPRIGISDG